MSINLDTNSLNCVLTYLPEDRQKEVLRYLQEKNPAAADYLLSLPENWKLALVLDPQVQKQIYLAAYPSKS